MEMPQQRPKPKCQPGRALPSLRMRRPVSSGAGALPWGEQGKAAGAESRGPAPHGPRCPPSPCPGCGGTLREPGEGALGGAELLGGTRTGQGERGRQQDPAQTRDLMYKNVPQWDYDSPRKLFLRKYEQQPSQCGNGSGQKPFPREYGRQQDPSQSRDVTYPNLSQWEDESAHKMSPWEDDRYQQPSQWGKGRVQDFPQWDRESVQQLPQWEDEKYQQQSQWKSERYPEVSQWVDKGYQELFQWLERKQQELSQWTNERPQELFQWANERPLELSQWANERLEELSQWLDRSIKELSQWEGRRAEQLSQAADGSDKVLCQGEGSIEQELSEGEIRLCPELFQEIGDHDQLSQENWEHLSIDSIWDNPKYPQLLQNSPPAPQESEQAAASPDSGEHGTEAGAESQSPVPHSPCCPPSPLSELLEALMKEWTGTARRAELPMPHTEQRALAKEEEEWKHSVDQELSHRGNGSVEKMSQCHDEKDAGPSQWEGNTLEEMSERKKKGDEELSQAQDDNVLCQWEDSFEIELSPQEVRGDPESSQEEMNQDPELSQVLDESDQELSQGDVSDDPELAEEGDGPYQELSLEYGERITIRTIWVNPKYPQLLQNPPPAPQQSAQAAASRGCRGQGTKARADLQVPRTRPSRFRRVLRALRRLFRFPCTAGQPQD